MLNWGIGNSGMMLHVGFVFFFNFFIIENWCYLNSNDVLNTEVAF